MYNFLNNKATQILVLVLTILANIALFAGALVDWEDALRPPFISACFVNAASFTVQYLVGRFVPGEGLPQKGVPNGDD